MKRMLLFAACCVGLLLPLAAEAALSVSPSRVVIQGKPGQKLAGEFHVQNTGSQPILVDVEPEDWAEGMTGSRGPVPWLTLKDRRFELKGGKARLVKYTVRIPKEAHGEIRAQIFFTSDIEGGSGMRSRLGAVLYVTIKDTQQVAGALGQVEAHYTASTPGASKPDRLDVVMRIHNRSNVHIIPEGEVVVKDARGLKVATVTLPEGWGLLPQEEDLYHAIASGVHLQPGRYQFEITIRCGADVQQPVTLTKTLQATLSPQYQWALEQPPAPTP